MRSAILSTLLSAPHALMGCFWITVVSVSNVQKNVWNAAVLRFAAYAWTATPPTLPEYACYNANSPAFRAWTTNQPSARPVPTPRQQHLRPLLPLQHRLHLPGLRVRTQLLLDLNRYRGDLSALPHHCQLYSVRWSQHL